MTKISAGSAVPGLSPQVCAAPAPAAGPIPIPYPNAPLKTGWQTTDSIRRVELQRKHGVTSQRAAQLTGTAGDEAGTLTGMSNSTNQKKGPMLGASQVKIQDKPMIPITDVRARF